MQEIPGATVRMLRQTPRPTRQEVLEAVAGADVAITMYHDPVNEEFLEAAGPKLRGVCNYAVGHENIDKPLCAANGIQVTNTPDAVTEGTANMAMALILGVARRIVESDRFARSEAYAGSGGLAMSELLGMHLTGQTLLIIGAGRIGKAVALRALGFGMRVLYVARSRHLDFEMAPIAAERVSLEDGLRRADVVTIHCPFTEETRHLINAERLAMMKPEAILVNTARGPVIDELALVESLRSGHLWGAGLDVFEFEPKVSAGLIELSNVIVTPHIGSGERLYREMMTDMVCRNAAAILRGEQPPNPVSVG